MADLTFAQRLTYSLPQLALNVSGMILGQWLVLFYRPPEDDVKAGAVVLVGGGVLAAIMILGRVVDALADPLIGYWSDGCRSRMGRRIPFILWGTPLLIASYLALWFPPFEPESTANGIYLAAAFSVYWIAFTAVVAPYVALLPEIAETPRARVVLSVFMGVFIVLGNLVGALSGALRDAYPEGATFLGMDIGSGTQLLGLIGGLSLLVFLLPLVNIREAPRSREPDLDRPGLYASIRSAIKNPAFWPLLGIAVFLQSATVMLITVLPFVSEQILERLPGEAGWVAADEGGGWVAILLGSLFLGAVLWMPVINLILKRTSRKRLMLRAGIIFGACMLAFPLISVLPEPALGALVLMLVLSFPASVALVLPNVLYGDAVDYDETLSGRRREGIYTGSMALVTKTALGLAGALTVGLLELGDSRSDPLGMLLVGPVAGALVFLGVWIFSHFPEDHIEQQVQALRAQRESRAEALSGAAPQRSEP